MLTTRGFRKQTFVVRLDKVHGSGTCQPWSHHPARVNNTVASNGWQEKTVFAGWTVKTEYCRNVKSARFAPKGLLVLHRQ